MQEKDLIKKKEKNYLEKKKALCPGPERRQKCYLQKPGCSESSAVQGHSHTSPTPTNSQSERPSPASTYTMASKQTKKQTGTACERSYLFVFHPHAAAETLLKISVSS